MICKETPNFIFLTIIEVILLISIITIVVLGFVGYNSLGYGLRAVSDINNNWKKSPIIDIVDARGDCPLDYEPFINDEWGGTVEGCDCNNRWSSRIPVGKRNKLNRETCSYNMTIAGCARIRPVSPIRYKTWKGVTLCAKKDKKTFEDYMMNQAAPNKGCRGNYKPCGTLDSLGNVLCVESSQSCPINKVVMQGVNAEAPKDYKYEKIPLGSNFNLYFTNEAISSNILLEVKLSEGSVCIDPEEKNSKYTQYLLDRDYYSYPCQNTLNTILYDPRYSQMDTMLKRELFNQNGINPLLQYLPEFPFNSLGANMDMVTRPFIGWKSSCINDPFYDTKIVTVLVEKIDSISSVKVGVIVVSIILLVFFVIEVVLKNSNKQQSTELWNGLESAFIVIAFIVLVLSFVCLSKLGEYSNEFENFNCGDSITNEVFMDIGKKFQANLTYDRTIMLFSFFNCIAYFLNVIGDILFVCFSKMQGRTHNNSLLINEQDLANSDFQTPNPNNRPPGSFCSEANNAQNNPNQGQNMNMNLDVNVGNNYYPGEPVTPMVNLNQNQQEYPAFNELDNNNNKKF